MNFFTFIFSIYLLVLSCVPCADKDERNINADSKTEISASNSKYKHQTENEACTPFCTCSCCAAPAFFQPIANYKIPKKVFPSVKYPAYEVSYSSQVSFTIWQPPKLS